MKITLSLTHNCNLTCRYCYAGKKFKKEMPLETAKKIIDFAMEITPPGEKITFGLFGGEPLLCFTRIKEIVEYIDLKRQTSTNPISINITTNGTLLDEPMLGYIKDTGIDLCVSIDGPAHIHNLNRRYKDGRGSYDDVIRKLRLAIDTLESVQVNAVYGPETLDQLPQTTLFLKELGVSAIHLNPNISTHWDETTVAKLDETYMQIANLYIESYHQGQEIAINLFDNKIIVFMKGGYEDIDVCGMGETEWGFAPSGNIYPCERLIGEDNDPSLRLGNIHTGLEERSVRNIVEHRGNRNEECQNCELEKYCMNWCGCTNFFMTGHTDLTAPTMCTSEKAVIQAARCILLTLKENDLFIDHFMEYFHERAKTQT